MLPDFIDHNIFAPFSSQDPIVLGLSGGADSVFLGEILFSAGFTQVAIAHFEHGLRGEESKKDQIFCSKKAQDWNFQFFTDCWSNPHSSEQKARRARYEFLQQTLQQTNSKAIFLAHHADDQIETILFQFLRGSGIKGLCGMKSWEAKQKLFRPLLTIHKQEILDFLASQNIQYRQDSSNLDVEKYDRNFLRIEILPLLQERFPHIQKTLSRNAQLFSQIDNFISTHTKDIASDILHYKENGNIQFSREKFLSLDPFLQGQIIKTLFAPKEISFEQITAIKELISTANSGKKKILLQKCIQVYEENVFVADVQKHNR